MIARFTLLAAALLSSTTAHAAEKPVEVMVLGAYHFGNPGLDTHNIKVDSVLTPERQRQLDAVARAMLTFKPTKVMVEMQSDATDLSVADYKKFTTERLKTEANEITQIGYRVANLAGLKDVQAIDEQPKDGEPDYYPYDKLLASVDKFGQQQILADANGSVKKFLAKFEADQKTATVAELLIRTNSDPIYTTNADYYALLPIGDLNAQTGADLNAMWYLRNAKIFGKLMKVSKPGDRVLVVYGGGHGFWLRHFAAQTSGYKFVDPLPYLKKALPLARK